MTYRNPKILASAKGRMCTLQISGVCNGNSETTVWAHSNQQRHGKGKGIKASDIFGCYACSACHNWLDSGSASRDDKNAAFQWAHETSLLILLQDGIII